MSGERRTAPRILVLGTLDTKGEEFAYLRDEILRRGAVPVIVDLGIMGTPLFPGDVPREVVIARGGASLEELRSGDRRGDAIETVIAGGAAVATELYREGRIDAVIAMGGGSGTTIGTTIMEALPFGLPKVVVTTLSRLHPWVRGTDVVVVRTLVDLVGLNAITRAHIAQAAAAVVGMASGTRLGSAATRSIVITCLGVTTPGVMELRRILLAAGKDVIVLHRRTHNVPLLVTSDLVEAVVDFTPNEITESVVHPGTGDADDRLREVRERGIPWTVSAGALDMLISFEPRESLPEHLATRPFVVHSRDATLVRTTVDEQALLGKVLGRQLRASQGPVAAVVPLGGFSMWDAPERAFDQPGARAAFADALEAEAPAGTVRRVDAHINSVEYAEALAEVLLEMLGSR